MVKCDCPAANLRTAANRLRILTTMFLVVAGVLIALDQITKIWAATTFILNGSGYTLGLGFHLTYIRNTGAAFGILQGRTMALGVLSAVVAAALLVYLWRNSKALPQIHYWALTLILGGAIGNMIDRFRLGYVIDFIHFYLPNFNYPVFNFADSYVVVGAGLLILSSFLPEPPSQHNPKVAAKTSDQKLTDPDFFRHIESDSAEH